MSASARVRSLMLLGLCWAALACAGPPPAGEERLLQELEDPRWQLRASAAEELGRRRAERAVDSLGAALSDDHPEVRAAAAMALGRLGARSEIDKIRRLVDEEPKSQVAVMALYALADLAAGEDGAALVEDAHRVSDRMYDDSRRVSRAARRVLRRLLAPAAADSSLQEFARWEARLDDELRPLPWLYERIEDRLTLAPDGECSLTRAVTVRGEGAEAIRKLALFLPASFPEVERVTAADGSSLAFESETQGEARKLWLKVQPIRSEETATFTLTARSRRLCFRSGPEEVSVVYTPVPVDARVRQLRVELALPARGVRMHEPGDLRLRPQAQGEAVILERAGLSRGEVEGLVVRVGLPAAAVERSATLPRLPSRAADLGLLAGIVAVILGASVAVVLQLRRKLGARSQPAILAAVLTAGACLFLTPILIEDSLPYYALARSVVLDGDLDRWNEYAFFNQSQAYAPDHRAALDPVSASLLRVPSVAAGDWVTWGINAVSPTHATNGFSFPYLFVTALGDFLTVLIGCLACFSIVERRVGRPYALFAVLSVVAGTNLLLFTYAWTGSSFQPSFCLFAVFLDHWDRTRERRSRAAWLGAGVLLGLLGATRTPNLGFLLIPLLDWIYTAAVRTRGEGPRGLLRHVGAGAWCSAGFFLGFAPQLLLHRLVDQAWFVDAYGVGTGRLTGLRENLWGLLIGSSFPARFDGLLLAMPVVCLALVGLLALLRFDPRLGAWLTAALALQLFAIGSYEVYTGYFEYGTPYLVPSSPILCLAMGSLLRAVHSRSRIWGPVLLVGLVLPMVARNAWCLLQQLGSDLVSGWSHGAGDLEVVHSLVMLDRKLDGDVLRGSSEFACLPRELAGALRAGDAGQFAAALGWLGLLVAATLLVLGVRSRAGGWAARIPPRVRARLAVVAPAAVWVALLLWLAALGRATDVNYRTWSEQRDEKKLQLEVERIGPGETLRWPLRLGDPLASVSVITFLEDALYVPQGTRVATLEFEAGERVETALLFAGVDTADYAVARPESQAEVAHRVPLDRTSYSWRVRDDSSHFYFARAYLSRVALPFAPVGGVLKVTSNLERGTLVALAVNAVEAKLPPDRARRRWLAERW